MIEIKNTDYEIKLNNIHDYETSSVVLGKVSVVLGLKILKKIEEVISNKSEPVLKSVDYDNGKDRYFKDYIEKYEAAQKDVEELFKLNFFIKDGNCYEYNQNLVIDNTYEDYDFWLALKLRQYEFRLSEIRNFLNFQLESNFANKVDEFIDFLKLNLNKYQTEIFENGVVKAVNDLIKKKFWNKLILEIKKDDLNLFNALKPYFDENEHIKLEQLINGEEIHNKICFRGNANQFVSLFKQLHLNQRIIGALSNTERWISNYFTYLNRNNEITDFNLEYVHKMLSTNSRTLRKANRIDLPGLEHIVVN